MKSDSDRRSFQPTATALPEGGRDPGGTGSPRNASPTGGAGTPAGEPTGPRIEPLNPNGKNGVGLPHGTTSADTGAYRGPFTAEECDVIVLGGSLAAYAAATTSAAEFKEASTARMVCLVEPTDWVGGQLTASGVSAVDFAYHKHDNGTREIDVSALSRKRANVAPGLWSLVSEGATSSLEGGSTNPGSCWVSVRCFLPSRVLYRMQARLGELASHLRVFYNSVPKRVSVTAGAISQVVIVERTPKAGMNPWTHRLSTQIADWYSHADSALFTKSTFVLRAENGTPLVIDASEGGEGLVLAGAEYVHGAERASEDDVAGALETCTQAFVFPMALERNAAATAVPAWLSTPEALTAVNRYRSHFALADSASVGGSGRVYSFEQVWSYRRLLLGDRGAFANANTGDVSQQNWTAGNDYPYKPLFVTKAQASAQVADWKGGVDPVALSEAEDHAFGWYLFLRQNGGAAGGTLSLSRAYGTTFGLSKLPYVREGRRSVGIGGYQLAYGGAAGLAAGATYGEETAAIGAYVPDIHPVAGSQCAMPEYVLKRALSPAPFSINLLALTNKSVRNMLVAGKSMAQSFLANSATRVHPVEFHSGVAAGLLASIVAEQGNDVHAAWAARATAEGALLAKYKDRAAGKGRSSGARLPLTWTE